MSGSCSCCCSGIFASWIIGFPNGVETNIEQTFGLKFLFANEEIKLKTADFCLNCLEFGVSFVIGMNVRNMCPSTWFVACIIIVRGLDECEKRNKFLRERGRNSCTPLLAINFWNIHINHRVTSTESDDAGFGRTKSPKKKHFWLSTELECVFFTMQIQTWILNDKKVSDFGRWNPFPGSIPESVLI